MAEDNSVAVEVFAHLGTLKGGQRHKVSTDALKLLAIREIHPGARLILAFVDERAVASVSGWKAETLVRNGIEMVVVELDEADRARIQAAQSRQKMINPT
jgi:diketogulonate reductase-like aldo/keto reductase